MDFKRIIANRRTTAAVMTGWQTGTVRNFEIIYLILLSIEESLFIGELKLSLRNGLTNNCITTASKEKLSLVKFEVIESSEKSCKNER